mmetsp:Transcript_14185/g.36754  ORF Transcript_14185/g.36754 Transcript_14185/m.36754 type:complete len:230 (-) Transcript_14185:462-1151(-)
MPSKEETPTLLVVDPGFSMAVLTSCVYQYAACLCRCLIRTTAYSSTLGGVPPRLPRYQQCTPSCAASLHTPDASPFRAWRDQSHLLTSHQLLAYNMLRPPLRLAPVILPLPGRRLPCCTLLPGRRLLLPWPLRAGLALADWGLSYRILRNSGVKKSSSSRFSIPGSVRLPSSASSPPRRLPHGGIFLGRGLTHTVPMMCSALSSHPSTSYWCPLYELLLPRSGPSAPRQ